MFCTNCGKRVDGKPRYCPNCGAPLRDAANPRAPEPPETAPAAPRRPAAQPVGYCPCCGGAVSEADKRWRDVYLPEVIAYVEYYDCPACHRAPSKEDLLASPKGADPAFECSIERMQRIAIERMKRGSNGEHEPDLHAASESSQASPGFCVMCGTRLEPGLRFCPSCGTLLH